MSGPEKLPKELESDPATDVAGSQRTEGTDLEPPPLADALGQVFRRLLFRGRQELGRAATSGRARLELRQMQRDLDNFWIRLGKTSYRLVESGEIEHPALNKAMRRIDELEARILELAGKSAVTERPVTSEERDVSPDGPSDE
jgi:hypothetical protein